MADPPPRTDTPAPRGEGPAPDLGQVVDAVATALAVTDDGRRPRWWNDAFERAAGRGGLSVQEFAAQLFAREPTPGVRVTAHAWRPPGASKSVSGWLIELAPRTDRSVAASGVAQADPVTGALMRAELDALCEAWFERRAKTPFALVFVDIDRFKQINDRQGHPAGDRCLRALAETLGKITRQGDVVGRYGGDEFVVLLAGVRDASTWLPVERRLRDAVSKRTDATGAEGPEPIGVSLGVAFSAEGHANVEEMLAAADRAMYAEKHAKRGRPTSEPGDGLA